MGRTPCCSKIGLKKGRWTAEEDEKLIEYVEKNGEGSWRSLPKNAGLLRCGKSCRLRWINYLRSDLKRENITYTEEEIIIRLQSTLGNKWSMIAAQLPGRTDNEIKNYWNSHLSRKIHKVTRPGPNGEADGGEVIINMVDVGVPRKRRGGRTSRAEMQRKRSSSSSLAINHHHNNSALDSHNNKGNCALNKVSDNSPNEKEKTSYENEVTRASLRCQENVGLLMEDKGGQNYSICDNNYVLESVGVEKVLMGLDGLWADESDVGPGSRGVGPTNTDFNTPPSVPAEAEVEALFSVTGVPSSSPSTTSTPSYLDHHDDDHEMMWNWEVGIVDDGHEELHYWWGEKEKIESWLWKKDDEILAEAGFCNLANAKEEDMLSWLLS